MTHNLGLFLISLATSKNPAYPKAGFFVLKSFIYIFIVDVAEGRRFKSVGSRIANIP